MEKLTRYRQLVQQILQEYSQQKPADGNIEVETIFDTERDHYQIVNVGWEGQDWVHSCIISVCQEVNKLFGYSTDELIVIENQMTYSLEDCADDPPEVVMVSITNLVSSPTETSLLSDEQKARVEIIAEIFANVFPKTLDAWIMDFSRDHTPETEISIWEHIATAFLKIEQVEFLDEEHKKEAYYLLLMRSMTSASKVLEQFKLKTFSRKAAKEILREYKLDPKPLVGFL